MLVAAWPTKLRAASALQDTAELVVVFAAGAAMDAVVSAEAVSAAELMPDEPDSLVVAQALSASSRTAVSGKRGRRCIGGLLQGGAGSLALRPCGSGKAAAVRPHSVASCAIDARGCDRTHAPDRIGMCHAEWQGAVPALVGQDARLVTGEMHDP
ncbi:hypothetical protein GCM10027430_02720 [Lysobacter tyrosinilyticus]